MSVVMLVGDGDDDYGDVVMVFEKMVISCLKERVVKY